MKFLKSIYLVEDDKDDQDFFIEALSQINDSVLHGIANNGREAINYLSQTVLLPSIIFMDLNMPVMNGIECLTEVLQNQHLKNIPIIILTTSSYHIETVTNVGAKAYLQKPFDVKILKNQIEYMLNFNFKTDVFNIGSLPY